MLSFKNKKGNQQKKQGTGPSLSKRAATGASVPSHQPVGYIARVAQSATSSAEVVAVVLGSATVVDVGASIVLGDVGATAGGDGLLEAVAGRSTLGSVADHLDDLGLWAWGLDGAGVVAGTGSIVVLHQTWVAHAVVGGDLEICQ